MLRVLSATTRKTPIVSSIERSCIGCGRVLEVFKRRPIVVGRPFVECSDCGALTTRDGYDEWLTMSFQRKAQLVGTGLAFALALGVLPALVYGFTTMGESEDLVLLVLGGVGILAAVGAWGARLVGTVRRSQRRMTDPMYLAKLARFGMSSSTS